MWPSTRDIPKGAQRQLRLAPVQAAKNNKNQPSQIYSLLQTVTKSLCFMRASVLVAHQTKSFTMASFGGIFYIWDSAYSNFDEEKQSSHVFLPKMWISGHLMIEPASQMAE